LIKRNIKKFDNEKSVKVKNHYVYIPIKNQLMSPHSHNFIYICELKLYDINESIYSPF